MARPASSLTPEELFETLSVWKRESAAFLGMLSTSRQMVFGTAHITDLTPGRVTVSLSEVLNRVEIAPEPPVVETSFGLADVAAAFQSTTFDQPNAGSVAEYFDEMLQVIVRSNVIGISLFRATSFKQKRDGAAG
jgi:hypothetical protein